MDFSITITPVRFIDPSGLFAVTAGTPGIPWAPRPVSTPSTTTPTTSTTTPLSISPVGAGGIGTISIAAAIVAVTKKIYSAVKVSVAASAIATTTTVTATSTRIANMIVPKVTLNMSPWTASIFERGRKIEQALGAHLGNFPVIDKYIRGRLPGSNARSITSIKSMDLRASSYLRDNTVYNRIMQYSRSLSNFSGDSWGGHTVRVGNSTQRILELAIPPGATPEQIQQIEKAVKSAAEIGVNIFTIIFQ